MHKTPEKYLFLIVSLPEQMGLQKSHLVTPLMGPGPLGCPNGGGWPGWKPPSGPPPRSSLKPPTAPSGCGTPGGCWGEGGSLAREGMDMVGPQDIIRTWERGRLMMCRIRIGSIGNGVTIRFGLTGSI